MDLLNKYVSGKFGENPELKEWEVKVPKDIRASAVTDLVSNYTSAFSNLKAGNISSFKMGYVDKKRSPAITMPLSGISRTNDKEIVQRTQTEIDKAKKRAGDSKTVSDTKKVISLTQTKRHLWFFNTILKDPIKIKRSNLKKRIVIDCDCKLV